MRPFSVTRKKPLSTETKFLSFKVEMIFARVESVPIPEGIEYSSELALLLPSKILRNSLFLTNFAALIIASSKNTSLNSGGRVVLRAFKSNAVSSTSSFNCKAGNALSSSSASLSDVVLYASFQERSIHCLPVKFNL